MPEKNNYLGSIASNYTLYIHPRANRINVQPKYILEMNVHRGYLKKAATAEHSELFPNASSCAFIGHMKNIFNVRTHNVDIFSAPYPFLSWLWWVDSFTALSA